MIHPIVAVACLVGGVIVSWFVAWYVTDLVVGSRKPTRQNKG